MQEKRREQIKDISSENPKPHDKAASPLEPLQDKILLGNLVLPWHFTRAKISQN